MAKRRKKIGVIYPTFNSFIVSLLLYFCLIFFLFYKVFTHDEIKKYTNQKDSFMDVFVVTDKISDTTSSPKKVSNKEEKPQVVQKENDETMKTTNKQVATSNEPPLSSTDIVKDEPPVDISFKELFNSSKISQVPTPSKDTAVQSNKKSSEKTAIVAENANNIINSLQKDLNAKAPKPGNTGEYDKFYGDVTEIIQRGWVKYKIDGDEEAKVTIVIDKFGKMSYNINKKSLNSQFNSKVIDYLESLKYVVFPIPPNNNSINLDIILKDKIDK